MSNRTLQLDSTEKATAWAGVALNSAIFGIVFFYGFCHLYIQKNKQKESTAQLVKSSTSLVFWGLCIFFLLNFNGVRVAMYLTRIYLGRITEEYFLNRSAECLYFTCCTLLIFYWAETFNNNKIYTGEFLPKMKWKFAAVNIAFYISQLTIAILWLESSRGLSREPDPVYNSGVYLTIFISLLVSIAFFLYGARLFYLRNSTAIGSEKKRNELIRIVIFTFIFTFCFLLRTIMFSYRPIYNAYINVVAFNVLAYYIPEALPCLLEIYIIHKSTSQIQKDAEFIQGLYSDEQFVSNYDSFDSTQQQQQEQKQDNENVTIRLYTNSGRYGSVIDSRNEDY